MRSPDVSSTVITANRLAHSRVNTWETSTPRCSQLAADQAAVVIVADTPDIGGASVQDRRTPPSPSPSARRTSIEWLEMRSLAVGLSAWARRAADRRDRRSCNPRRARPTAWAASADSIGCRYAACPCSVADRGGCGPGAEARARREPPPAATHLPRRHRPRSRRRHRHATRRRAGLRSARWRTSRSAKTTCRRRSRR